LRICVLFIQAEGALTKDAVMLAAAAGRYDDDVGRRSRTTR